MCKICGSTSTRTSRNVARVLRDQSDRIRQKIRGISLREKKKSLHRGGEGQIEENEQDMQLSAEAFDKSYC